MKECGSERPDDEDDVTASEVAAYTYCAKAWHLERVLHVSADPQGQARRAQGIRRHVDHGTQLNRLRRYGRGSLWVSVSFLLLAIALLMAALVL